MREVSTDQGRDAEEDATEDSSDVSGYHSDSDSAVMASGNSPFVSKSARYNFLSRSGNRMHVLFFSLSSVLLFVKSLITWNGGLVAAYSYDFSHATIIRYPNLSPMGTTLLLLLLLPVSHQFISCKFQLTLLLHFFKLWGLKGRNGPTNRFLLFCFSANNCSCARRFHPKKLKRQGANVTWVKWPEYTRYCMFGLLATSERATPSSLIGIFFSFPCNFRHSRQLFPAELFSFSHYSTCASPFVCLHFYSSCCCCCCVRHECESSLVLNSNGRRRPSTSICEISRANFNSQQKKNKKQDLIYSERPSSHYTEHFFDRCLLIPV